ncbi:MAG: class B sortase [Clostridia bacterium]|nr:class B sortase [Clostridia bacterium]MBR5753982.1 class B sortase [Clostridia bacterium]
MSDTKKRRNMLLTVLEVLFALIFLFAVFQAGRILYSYHEGDSFYEDSQDQFLTETDTPASEGGVGPEALGFQVDLAGLQKVNPDVKGWIYIPDTAVSYPLLWSKSDNTYLRTTYTGEHSVFGSIFFSHQCSPELTDQHTIIYGHNTKNGSMFGGLKEYKKKDYFYAHPYVYLIMKGTTYQYRVVSCFTANTSDDVYILSFAKNTDFQKWIAKLVVQSDVDPGTVAITGMEQVLTLSTCTSRTKTERFVVNAIQVSSWPNTF